MFLSRVSAPCKSAHPGASDYPASCDSGDRTGAASKSLELKANSKQFCRSNLAPQEVEQDKLTMDISRCVGTGVTSQTVAQSGWES